jgi:hypothetical protein
MSTPERKKLPTWLLVIVIALGTVLGLLMIAGVLVVVGLGLLAYTCSTHSP